MNDHDLVDLLSRMTEAPCKGSTVKKRPAFIKTHGQLLTRQYERTYTRQSTARAWQTPVSAGNFTAMANAKKFHEDPIMDGMPTSIAHHKAHLIDKHMKSSILRLDRSDR